MVYVSYLVRALRIGGINLNEDFKAVVEEYEELIDRLIASRIENKSDREDLKQEVLMIIFEKSHTVRDITMMKFWLIKVVKNVCHRFYRLNTKRDYPLDSLKLSVLLNKHNVKEETKYSLDEYVSVLSRKQQDVVMDFYFRGLKIKDIAIKYNIPVGTVKSRLNTSKRILKERIEKDVNNK